MLSPDERRQIRARVEQFKHDVPWVELAHAPRALVTWRGAERPMELLRGKKVAAFCGIGNPAGFRHTLDGCGCEIAGWREFPDHHNYARDDVQSLGAWASELRSSAAVEAVVCTHKDLVKIQSASIGELPLWAVAIGIELLAGCDTLEQSLAGVLAQVDHASTQPPQGEPLF
jgi:tetraacyldisaccharide 4'-kinase